MDHPIFRSFFAIIALAFAAVAGAAAIGLAFLGVTMSNPILGMLNLVLVAGFAAIAADSMETCRDLLAECEEEDLVAV